MVLHKHHAAQAQLFFRPLFGLQTHEIRFSCASSETSLEGRSGMASSGSYKNVMGGKLQLKGDPLPTINKTYAAI